MALWDYDGNVLKSLYRISDSFTLIFFTYFIGGRILSCLIKLEFMIYQNEFRLEELDIAKEQFNKIERNFTRTFNYTLALYAILAVMLSLIKNIIFLDDTTVYMEQCYSCLLLISYLIIIKFYFVYNYRAFAIMNKKH